MPDRQMSGNPVCDDRTTLYFHIMIHFHWLLFLQLIMISFFSVALTFILHNAHVIRIGDNWFNDALCVLADVVFFFVPEYLLGPRLIPLLIAILILAHLLLPIFHGFSFILVFSYYR